MGVVRGLVCGNWLEVHEWWGRLWMWVVAVGVGGGIVVMWVGVNGLGGESFLPLLKGGQTG